MRIAPVAALCLLSLASLAEAGEAHLRLARYTTASASPDPARSAPLAVLAQVRFPREAVRTVGDALHYLLLRTGYRVGHTDAAASALLALPLPEAHREIGPYSVKAIASVLVGSAYALQVSEIDRRLDVALPERVPTARVAETPAIEHHAAPRVTPVALRAPLPEHALPESASPAAHAEAVPPEAIALADDAPADTAAAADAIDAAAAAPLTETRAAPIAELLP